MGYTHYWYRDKGLDPESFAQAASDFREVVNTLAEGELALAGADGGGAPIIWSNIIEFNGRSDCYGTKDPRAHWQGDCSHESFYIPVEHEVKGDWDTPKEEEGGKYFDCCKTALKPYDVAVTACLIILKHHLGDAIVVHSDGEMAEWEAGQAVCMVTLDYGEEFTLDQDEEDESE